MRGATCATTHTDCEREGVVRRPFLAMAENDPRLTEPTASPPMEMNK